MAEVLGAAIRNCKDIRGVRLLGSSEESKISQYAYDGNLTLVEYFICKAFEIVRIFEKGSVSELNLDKTESMWFGSMARRKDGPVNIKMTSKFSVFFLPGPMEIFSVSIGIFRLKNC